MKNDYLSPQRRRERLALGKKCPRCSTRAANAMKRCPRDGVRLVSLSYDGDAITELEAPRITVCIRAATLGMMISLTACGPSTVEEMKVPAPKPTMSTARQTAALSLSDADWQKLWSTEQPPPPMMMQPPPGPPPKEATDACIGTAPGGACSFTHDGMPLTGTCGKTPEGQAVCMPSMMMMAPMEKVFGGTLSGLTGTPVLVQVRPTDTDRLKITASDFVLEASDQRDGSLDLTVDHGDGPQPAGYYRRTNL